MPCMSQVVGELLGTERLQEFSNVYPMPKRCTPNDQLGRRFSSEYHLDFRPARNAGRSAYGSSKASVELLSKVMDAAAKDCFKSDIMKRVDR